MRVIHKKISLEPFKSRMPSIIPAYDENGMQHNFTHMVDLNNQPLINYGMIPYDVQVDEDKKLGQYSGQLYSYQQLVKIYHKLDAFYESPITDDCKETVEISDEDKYMYEWLSTKCFPYFVFDNELNNELTHKKLNEIKLSWGVSKLSILEIVKWITILQDLQQYSGETKYCCEYQDYLSKGGDAVLEKMTNWYNKIISTILCPIGDYGHDITYNVKDSDTTITVKVLKELKNKKKIIATHKFEICQPRVKILGNNRYIKYGQISSNGDIMYPRNIEIIDGILTIPCLNTSEDSFLIINEPSLMLPITLNTNIDNLGEMMSICEDWQEGYEYNNDIDNYDNLDYNGGPMVYYNNDTWILDDYTNQGYIYSNKFKEVYFGTPSGMTEDERTFFEENKESDLDVDNFAQWKRYFDYLPKIDDITPKEYTYKNNQIILNPNPLIMSDTYEIFTNNMSGYCVLNDVIYSLSIIEYVEFNKKKYQVHYVFQNYKPYIIVNNKQIFINTNNKCDNLNGKFTFDILSGTGFTYGTTVELVDDYKNEFIDGYATINGNNIYFIKKFIENEEIYVEKEYKDNDGEYIIQPYLGTWVNKDDIKNQDINTQYYSTYVQDNKVLLIITNSYIAYDNTKVIGVSSSKLNDMADEFNIAIDNMGNRLHGLFPIQYNSNDNWSYNFNPTTNDWLSIPYVPKYINDIEKIEEREGYELYWGNIIDEIVITYDEISGDGVIKSGETAINDSQLKAIETYLHKNIQNISNIRCTVVYYIGTYIKYDSGEGYTVFTEKDDFYGIKYKEILTLTPKQCQYFIDNIKYHILNYFEITQETQTFLNSNYNVQVTESVASFEYMIKPFTLQYGYLDYSESATTFYRVDELTEYVGDYPITFNGSKKCFSFPINNDNTLYKCYGYYCFYNDKKHYAVYNEKDENFSIIVNNKEYQSNGMKNKFYNEKNELVETIYCEIPIKLYLITTNGTFDDNYYDFTNDMIISPLIFNENKIGFDSSEKISENIYIDRGTVRALDFHLRLMETKSLESLEQIGNGFYQFNSNN